MWAWILSLLLALRPDADRGSLLPIAVAIDDASHESPVYDDNDGAERTAAELVAVGFFESHFDPNAVGDHGASIGFGQIGVSNLRELGLSRDDLLDLRTNLRAMTRFLRASHRTCRGSPARDQLAAYATGRGQCLVPEGVRASRNRMDLAARLLRERAPYWTDRVGEP